MMSGWWSRDLSGINSLRHQEKSCERDRILPTFPPTLCCSIRNKNSLARKLTAGACVLHIFYLSSSFLFHVYLQRKRKINIRRNKKEEGEDRRLPTVETRTSGRLVVYWIYHELSRWKKEKNTSELIFY